MAKDDHFRRTSLECGQCKQLPFKGSRYDQCSRCKMAYYCSRECQRAHWKAHKPECDLAARQTIPFLSEEVNDRFDLFLDQYRKHLWELTYYAMHAPPPYVGLWRGGHREALLITLRDASPQARRPRFLIESYTPVVLQRLPLDIQRFWADVLNANADPSKLLSLVFLRYQKPDGKKAADIRSFDFEPGQFPGNPSDFEKYARDCHERINQHVHKAHAAQI